MSIIFNEESKEFHLFNNNISYIIKILKNEQLGQLYFGKRVPIKESYGYLLETVRHATASYPFENDFEFSLEHIKQEYPAYGTTDFRMPAVEVLQPNGSRITNFTYVSHRIFVGKPELSGLPATYVESEKEATTLEILLRDELIQVEMLLRYTIFEEEDAIARSVYFENKGTDTQKLTTAMSLSLDLPDDNYEWIQFSGAWGRERHVKKRMLQSGIQAVNSTRGASSHNQNPFVVLKRPNADEFQGEAIGFSFVYSGNFLIQAEVDNYHVTRMTVGLNPFCFTWNLEAQESFQTPEAVMVYSSKGMNHMSQTFHHLYRTRLARGYWRDKERPVLINNWEATYFNFNEEKLLQIAKTAKEDGIELFVLDDGWFSSRRDDSSGLGDWWVNTEVLPNGIKGLSEKIEALGMQFGLWFELEMVNKPSELYKNHPDWILHVPGRRESHGRGQYVLDFSRKEVVDYIYSMVEPILKESKISYIKWDMNRYITECFSEGWDAERQGEVSHRYILGVYDLYERLTRRFPEILFESCASGGGRFDSGLLYYAPQCWTSDDTDAVERIKIQYGTSYCYPISSMGAHVSITPNHQVFRNTSMKFRADVAYFGAFGYELDLSRLSEEEHTEVRKQVEFVKKYRKLIQQGTYYRLQSPFESNVSAWMIVSEDKKQVVLAYYKILNEVMSEFRRLRLQGLSGEFCYTASDETGKIGEFYGEELMNIGFVSSDHSAREQWNECHSEDFWSRIVVFEAKQDSI